VRLGNPVFVVTSNFSTQFTLQSFLGARDHRPVEIRRIIQHYGSRVRPSVIDPPVARIPPVLATAEGSACIGDKMAGGIRMPWRMTEYLSRARMGTVRAVQGTPKS